LATAAVTRGAWLARRHLRQPWRALAWPMEGELIVDGRRTQSAALQCRGPLVFLHWRDEGGRCHRLAWWPDTLSRAGRRELRLAATNAPPAPAIASMAP
jgi:toxin CptA